MERGFSRQQDTKELFTQSTIVAFVSTSAYLEIKNKLPARLTSPHKKNAANLKLTAGLSF
jgi:hypothetical protein